MAPLGVFSYAQNRRMRGGESCQEHRMKKLNKQKNYLTRAKRWWTLRQLLKSLKAPSVAGRKDITGMQRCKTKKRNVARKKGAQPGNKNSSGGPPGNKKAEKHGFFAKWLPEETREINNCIEHSNPIDLLWDNIQLQYAATIRAQNLIYVRDQDDKTREKVGSSTGKVSSQTWEVQQAWDKNANFLQAQSRAMKTLESMIKQYDDLTRSSMDTEEQRVRIDKLKCEMAKMNGESEAFENDGFIEALKGNITEV